MRKYFLISSLFFFIQTTKSREIVFSNSKATKIVITEKEDPKNYLRNLWQIHEFRKRASKKKISKDINCEHEAVDMSWDEIKTQHMKLCLKIPFHNVFFTKMTADIK